ncbi:hypothetical protein CCM_03580 [Cordyceps militaris CM01]|uniref:Uncharacterized protein n=1 Tax=Cordyceps militaris (strain CM01) TaxID=983644 RepID=G3JBK3_CORMM|nr:uncharacterized protein CCM_03580 [Cordyceps militaris CM01]EGX95308.1 hypothetical protein CCM_03580 [Cordyceps militaris CM01]
MNGDSMLLSSLASAQATGIYAPSTAPGETAGIATPPTNDDDAGAADSPGEEPVPPADDQPEAGKRSPSTDQQQAAEAPPPPDQQDAADTGRTVLEIRVKREETESEERG